MRLKVNGQSTSVEISRTLCTVNENKFEISAQTEG